MNKLMFTITGPSCAGKTTLLATLLSDYPNLFANVISDTTRAPRDGEVHGEEYAFIDEVEFKRNQKNGIYCQTVYYGNVYYGTRYETITSILESGKVPLRVVEPTGVAQFREVCAEFGVDVVAVFVNEDLETIVWRWLQRCRSDSPEKDEVYAYRIIKTIQEEQAWVEQPIYDYYYDLRFKAEAEHLFALSRIANGAISIPMIRRMSPNIYEQA